MTNNISQLVIVCRDFTIDWEQFLNPIFIGVETGILALIKHNKPITFMCGDNDTLLPQQWAQIIASNKNLSSKMIIFEHEKDFLDSELAITIALERKIAFQQLVIVADGNRWDMFLASINLLKKYQKFNPILVGENNYCFVLKEGEKYDFTKQQLSYKYISFFSFDNNVVVYNFTGCKYYGNIDITIDGNNTQAVSNEFIVNVTIKHQVFIKKGYCLVVLHKSQ